MKKTLLYIVIALVLGALLISLLSPRRVLTWLGPETGDIVYLEADVSGQKVQEEMALPLKNGLIPIRIDSLFLNMEMEGEEVLQSNRKEDLNIGTFARDTLNLEATLRHKEIYEIIKTANEENRDSLQTRTSGHLYYRLPLLGSTEIPFSKDLKVRTPILPEVSVEDITVEEVSLPDLRLEIQLEIINRDTMDITIRQLAYNLRINEDAVAAEGITGENTVIRAQDTTRLDIPVEPSLGVAEDVFVELIEEGSSWPYEMDTHVELSTDLELFRFIVMDMQVSDTVDVMEQIEQTLQGF